MDKKGKGAAIKSKPQSAEKKKEKSVKKDDKPEGKESDKGKRPVSGYILFTKDERPNVVKAFPEMKGYDVLGVIERSSSSSELFGSSNKKADL